MQAAVRYRYGTPDVVVELKDLDRPVPADDQVLVRVRAASVNRADLDGLGPRPAFVRLGTASTKAATPPTCTGSVGARSPSSSARRRGRSRRCRPG